MKNTWEHYPDTFNQHLVHCKIVKDFACDENYKYVPKNIFYRIWSDFLDVIAISVFTIYFRIFQRVKIVGREKYKKVRKEGAGIIVHNHVQLFDAVMISTLINRMPALKILALEESFGVTIARFFMKSVGAIPIPQKSFKANKNFIKEMNNELKKGHFISVAPEGYMWPYYPGLRPFYLGAFRFAVTNNKPVLPIVVLFRKKKPTSKHVYPTLKILDPIYPDLSLSRKEAEIDLGKKAYEAMKKELIAFYPKDTPYLNFVDEEVIE